MRSIAEVVIRTLPAFWAGMIVAISFIETPLKFKAPEITLERGLGIGRLVFHALNRVELVVAALIVIAMGIAPHHVGAVAIVAFCVAAASLLAQVLVIRPVLDRRLAQRLAGVELTGGAHHIVYIVLESLKLIATIVLAVAIARHTGSI